MDDPTQYLRFVAALIFVLALIGAGAYALRAFGFIQQGARRQNDRRLGTESMLLDARAVSSSYAATTENICCCCRRPAKRSSTPISTPSVFRSPKCPAPVS
jgi:hypothetical protein